MDYYTAEYQQLNKTFRAESLAEATKHANVVGYGEKPTCVREATDGEIDGAKAKYARDVDGTHR